MSTVPPHPPKCIYCTQAYPHQAACNTADPRCSAYKGFKAINSTDASDVPVQGSKQGGAEQQRAKQRERGVQQRVTTQELVVREANGDPAATVELRRRRLLRNEQARAQTAKELAAVQAGNGTAVALVEARNKRKRERRAARQKGEKRLLEQGDPGAIARHEEEKRKRRERKVRKEHQKAIAASIAEGKRRLSITNLSNPAPAEQEPSGQASEESSEGSDGLDDSDVDE